MSSDAGASGGERLAAAFAAARAEGRAALMPYMMAGFPDRYASLAIARAYADGGADLVEVGVPFSDPLADGPVIHAAATKALEAAATDAPGAGSPATGGPNTPGGGALDSALAVVAELGPGVPAVVMCYVNPILAEGPERFAGRIAEAGAGGVIIPDLPHGEAPAIDAALRERGLAAVPLIAPTTTPERLAEICTAAEGFIYLVATTGTTGERSEVSETLAEQIEAIRAETDVPVAVGFGIGTAEQAGAVGALADGVIIGSRLVRTVAEADSPAAAAAACAEFLANCRTALLRA